MNDFSTHASLLNFCGLNADDEVKIFLEENPHFNILYEKGIYFLISIKHNNEKMLKIILEFFTKTQLNFTVDSLEYKIAKYKLKKIFEDADRMFIISKEVKELIRDYLPDDSEGQDNGEEMAEESGFENMGKVLFDLTGNN